MKEGKVLDKKVALIGALVGLSCTLETTSRLRFGYPGEVEKEGEIHSNFSLETFFFFMSIKVNIRASDGSILVKIISERLFKKFAY